MIDNQIAKFASKMDTLELANANGKPLGSERAIKTMDK